MSDITKLQNLVAAIATMTSAYKTALETRTAPDSVKLGGVTLAGIRAEFGTGTAAAVDVIAADLAAFIARRDNPNQVTKAQVGLGLVENFRTATDVEALAGTATDLLMTPANVQAVSDARWAASVGSAPETLDTISEVAAAIEANGSVVAALTAIANGKETVEGSQAKVDLLAAQVSASLIAGLALKLDATAQAVDSAKLDGRTRPQIIAEAVAAVNPDSKLGVNATADNSVRLNGKTQAELTASAVETIAGTESQKFTTPVGVKAIVDSEIVTVTAELDSHSLALIAINTRHTDHETYIDDAFATLAAAFNNAAVNV
jgi:hypothetical protein